MVILGIPTMTEMALASERHLEEELLYGLDNLPVEEQEAILVEMDMIDVLYSQDTKERSRHLLSVALSAS